MALDNSNDRLSSLQKEIMSGLTAGCITSTLVHPLDLIKLRLQLLSTERNKKIITYKYKHIINEITNNGSLKLQNFYRGLSINVIGNSIAWGLYFGSYRTIKDFLFQQYNIDNNNQSIPNFNTSLIYLSSGTLGGIFTSIITNPIWVLKTRIMSTNKNSHNKSYDSILNSIRSLVSKEGYTSFFKGLTPSIFGVSQGAIYFMVYDSMKQYSLVKKDQKNLNTTQTILITSISKMISTTTLYPLHLLKSNLQSTNLANQKISTINLISQIYYHDGIKGFYNGLATNLFKAIPTTCITFCIYESMKGYL